MTMVIFNVKIDVHQRLYYEYGTGVQNIPTTDRQSLRVINVIVADFQDRVLAPLRNLSIEI